MNFKRGDFLHVPGAHGTKHPAVHLGNGKAVYLDPDGAVDHVPEESLKGAEKMKRVTSHHAQLGQSYLRNMGEENNMSLNKIILEALAKNPVGLKESLSEILSEKIAIALERKIEESTQLDEISGSTLGSYMVKANKDMKKNRDAASTVMTKFMRRDGVPTQKDIDDAQSEYMKYDKKANNRNRGLSNAESKLKGSSFVKIHATDK